MRRVLAATFLALAALRAGAHPLAQGSAVIDVRGASIVAHLTVPTEEAIVEDASHPSGAVTLEDTWKEHGDYLASHFHVRADGRACEARVAEVGAPAGERITYVLDFEAPRPPSSLDVDEDVLSEIEYAPGNPWETTFVVTLQRDGRTISEGLLVRTHAPLALALPAPGAAAAATVDRGRLVRDYLRHGIHHILTGYDHLLFIMALALATTTLLDLVKVISAFTLAHSITLTLATLDIFRLPSSIVEPFIALSIVCVALQNVLWPKTTRGKGRLAIAFAFGLFHGLGFAGGLLDAMSSMSGVSTGIAIASFSLGVEIGHQAVVMPTYLALKALRRHQPTEERANAVQLAALRHGSALIAVAGAVYLIAALRESLA